MTSTGSKLIIILSSLLLLSCSHAPFGNKNAAADSEKKTAKTETTRTQQGEPQPGDIHVTDGVEYVYGKNPRYMSSPGEPLYIWMRKDQYSPGILDSLRSRSPVPTKEEKEMEARIAKLEDELKKTGAQPQMVSQMAPSVRPGPALPAQPVSLPPVALVSKTSLPTSAPDYPSPRMKRHLLVLPITGTTDLKSGELAERVTNRLIAKLESTGMLICLDPGALGFRGDVAQIKDLDELHGIQAVVKVTLSDTPALYGTKISLTVYNAETGLILRQLSSAGLVAREQEAGSETERMKAMDVAIEPIAEDVLKSVLSLDWHARIASTEQGKIFINAGRLSGLEKGDTLEVYAPGAQIVDAATRMPLGKLKGEYRGEIEVAELFGVDAAWAKPRRGEHFSPTDLVYLKR